MINTFKKIVRCPKCDSPMKKRNGTFGEFYGCSTFPKCRGIRQVKAVEIYGEGKVTGLKCLLMDLSEIKGDDGRHKVIPIDGAYFDLDADTVVLAMGERQENKFFSILTIFIWIVQSGRICFFP